MRTVIEFHTTERCRNLNAELEVKGRLVGLSFFGESGTRMPT